MEQLFPLVLLYTLIHRMNPIFKKLLNTQMNCCDFKKQISLIMIFLCVVFFILLLKKMNLNRHHTDNNWHIIALCDLVNSLPKHPDVLLWKNAIKMYCDDFVLPVSKQNIFGLTPYGIYLDQNQFGRQLGRKIWYRYFKGHFASKNSQGDYKYLGMNANIAGKGVALMKAAKIFNNKEYAAVAQHQLDWILGMNPFNKSTMVGVGPDQPIHYTGSQSPPKTPLIDGAVRNGIVGDINDEPDLMNGSWQTCEYWTPMVGMTAWLFAEISTNKVNDLISR